MALLLEDLTTWQFDTESGLIAGKIIHQLETKGRLIGFRAVFIAATALANGCHTIVTNNQRDFRRIPGIKVISYR